MVANGLVASIPDISGILKSIRMMSGDSSARRHTRKLDGFQPFLPKWTSGEDDHVLSDAINEMLECRAVVNISCVAIPVDNKPQLVQQQTKFATDNPAAIRAALAANLLVAPPFNANSRASVTTSLGQSAACGCFFTSSIMSSTRQNNSMIKSSVVIGFSYIVVVG